MGQVEKVSGSCASKEAYVGSCVRYLAIALSHYLDVRVGAERGEGLLDVWLVEVRLWMRLLAAYF